LDESDYRSKLAAAGFANIEIEATRVYRVEDWRASFSPARGSTSMFSLRK